MRVLIDTCVLLDYIIDPDSLSNDVDAIFHDYDNTFYISAETERELIVNFNTGGIASRVWKSAIEMIDAIHDEFFIETLPLKREHMRTYAHLEVNWAQGHKDPSDHVIISHAITEHLPLISSDGKFDFYRKQGLDFIFNKR
ncbi:MAG: PIN domain-containing protein [Prevotella sp.]|nr:PIN domain-containing protein [Prevotella sp.]